ncbi:MAG TPA: TonB-dependent receptor plug domain-containing protein, partial [Lentimicrobium sp.]|nr:TonB-dependent receptor plug domain-containing protein [Lentimicrobium sp.]
MRRFVFLGFLFLVVWPAFSQEPISVSDTVVLDEIVSYGNLRKYQVGSKIESIGDGAFSLAKGDDLEQLLSRSLPVAFKADAGGLSTIRIRGTGSSHTSVNFGGIDLNSLTLGQSNFSNVPVYLFDRVGVQFGSASSVNGSGSIGGAVHLGLNHNWTNGFRAEVRLSHGSFGEQLYGTKLFAGNGKFESVTRAYYYYKTNDFPFLNNMYRDFENQVFEIDDVQQNASLEHYGLLQELNYRLEPGEYFFANVWLERDWRQNQQNMQTNLNNPDYSEEYLDEHIRIWTGYKNHKHKLKYEVNGGHVYDNAVTNEVATDTIATRRWIAEIIVEHDLSSNTSYKAGAKAIRINPMVYAYKSSLDHEDRMDIYASFYQRIFRQLSATVNLRQGFVSNYKVPFTPSLGLSWQALSG